MTYVLSGSSNPCELQVYCGRQNQLCSNDAVLCHWNFKHPSHQINLKTWSWINRQQCLASYIDCICRSRWLTWTLVIFWDLVIVTSILPAFWISHLYSMFGQLIKLGIRWQQRVTWLICCQSRFVWPDLIVTGGCGIGAILLTTALQSLIA